MVIAGFYSSDNAKMRSLLQLLKKNGIISEYVIRLSHHNRIMENPNFHGDPIPSIDTLLDPVCASDYSYGQFRTEWNQCDMALLPHLLTGYKGTKLIEILKKEKEYDRKWTYNQINYSHKKMITAGLISREYAISPFPYDQCVHFILFIKPNLPRTTIHILHNFGRGERIYKEHMPFKEWGLIECISHPLFLINLLDKLDSIEEIAEKELYHVRSLLPQKYWLNPMPEFPYDFDTSTVEYPYDRYREKMKEKLEKREMI
jgi:hypothetical protein